MPLIERLMGLESPKIPCHQFQSIMGEWARGNMSGAQAQAAIVALCGAELDAASLAEATALVATVPTGSTTANKADRALRLQEIDQVLMLVDLRVPPADNPTAVRARLGI